VKGLLTTTEIAVFILLPLILFIFSPLYDIINNYTFFVFGSSNDFEAIKITTSSFLSHFTGILFSLLALMIALRILVTQKGYPFENQ